MKYHFTIHDDPDGLWAECIELPGCVTQAESLDELYVNMEEALNLYCDEPVDSTRVDRLPSNVKKRKGVVAVPVQPSIAFSLYVRHLRKKYNLTQKEMMERLNMNSLFSFQRLERKGDPRLSTLMRIKKVFPELSVDDILDV